MGYCSEVRCSAADTQIKLLECVVSCVHIITGVCLSVILFIVHLKQYCVCCIRSDATDTPSLWCSARAVCASAGYARQSKWTKGSILTKIIGTYKSDMPGHSAGNYVTFHEFHSLLICNGVK